MEQISFPRLPDKVVARVFHHLCTASPCYTTFNTRPIKQPENAFPLAQASTRYLELFRSECLTEIDVRAVYRVSSPSDFIPLLERDMPILPCQRPRHLNGLIQTAGAAIKEIHLAPLGNVKKDTFDKLLALVRRTCPHLVSLSFTCVPDTELWRGLPDTLTALEVHNPSSKLLGRIGTAAFHPSKVTFTGLREEETDSLMACLKKKGISLTCLRLAFGTGISECWEDSLCRLRNEIVLYLPNLRHMSLLSSEMQFRCLPRHEERTISEVEETISLLYSCAERAHQSSSPDHLSSLCVDLAPGNCVGSVLGFASACGVNTRIEVETMYGTLVFPEGEYELPFFKTVRGIDGNLSVALMTHPFLLFREVEDITLGEKSPWNFQAPLLENSNEFESDVSSLPVICADAKENMKSIRIRFGICSEAEWNRCFCYLYTSLRSSPNVSFLEVPCHFLEWIGTKAPPTIFERFKELRCLLITNRECRARTGVDRMLNFLVGIQQVFRLIWGVCPHLEQICAQNLASLTLTWNQDAVNNTLECFDQFRLVRPEVEIQSICVQVQKWKLQQERKDVYVQRQNVHGKV